MTDFVKLYKWKIVGTIVGMIAGYAYYYYVGCNSGTCPIQSHWHTSTLYGGLIGYVFVNNPKKAKSENEKDQTLKEEKQE